MVSEIERVHEWGFSSSFRVQQTGLILSSLEQPRHRNGKWDRKWKQTSYLEAEWNARHADLSWPAAAYLRRSRSRIRWFRTPAVHLIHNWIVIFGLNTWRSWKENKLGDSFASRNSAKKHLPWMLRCKYFLGWITMAKICCQNLIDNGDGITCFCFLW